MQAEVVFDADAYSADAIQRAAYRFTDRCSMELRHEGGVFRCVLFVTGEEPGAIDGLVAEFRNEVLDQVLRERIRVETEGVRNLVLSHAFSRTGLTDE